MILKGPGLISRLICITAASMLRLTTMSREHRADMPRQGRRGRLVASGEREEEWR
jgi:hypothetical protein